MALDSAKAKQSQEIVPIQEIREGIVILKDGSLRIILMASSLNFALKSSEEREAIIAQYQNFLNSLDFSVQFFISSRFLNIESYLDTLRELERQQTNELLAIQNKEYIEFIKNFVELAKIVNKTFYIIIPYHPPILEIKEGVFGGVSRLWGTVKSGKKEVSRMDDKQFEEYRIQLWQRADSVVSGLARTGVRLAPLNSEEVIELFYGLYNPGESGKGKAPRINV